MIESGLKKAATVSFIIHLALISATFITINRTPPFQMPSPYTVRLVSPETSAVKAQKVPPQKTDVPPAKDIPPEPKGVRTVEKEPPPPKKSEDLTKYSDQKIAALRKEQEQKEYRDAKDKAIQDLRKYAKVKELGAQKATVEVTDQTAGETGIQAEGSIVGDYTSMVASLIDQEWILFDIKANGIYAILTIRVMKNGALKIINIERSSGDTVFDRSALRAVEKASPVPPPPYEMELGVRFIPIQ